MRKKAYKFGIIILTALFLLQVPAVSADNLKGSAPEQKTEKTASADKKNIYTEKYF